MPRHSPAPPPCFRLLLGALLLILGSAPAVLAQAPQQGDLDTTFGTAGKVRFNPTGNNEVASAMQLQADGKIVTAGTITYLGGAFDDDFIVARFNSNGSLDTSFNSSGYQTVAFGALDDYGRALQIQPDGKMLVAGYHENGSDSDFALVRFNTNGSLDTSFNITGKVTTNINGGQDQARGMALQSDGKIVLTGMASFGAGGLADEFVVVRYLADGSLDTSFNTTGKRLTDFSGGHDEAHDVAVQADGGIVAVGYARVGGNDNFALARYLPDGSLDTSFGTGGKVHTDIGSSTQDYGMGVTLQSDGKIIVCGYSRVGSFDAFTLVRYLSNGSLDTTFNGTGKVTTAVGTSVHSRAYSVRVQADGKIVTCGSSGHDYAWARYQPNGTLDTALQGSGSVVTGSMGLNSSAADLAIQSDGKVILAGIAQDSSFDTGIVRYHSAIASTITTAAASNVTKTTVTLHGSVNPNGNDTTVTFEYGLTTSYGSSITATPNSVSGSSTVTVSASLSGLPPGTTYHYRLVGTNSAGTTIAENMTFTTASEQGDLDSGFGTLGKVRSDLTGNHDSANSVIILSDGKFLVGGSLGYVGNSNGEFMLSRYNANGTLDTTFNGTGYVTASLSTGSEEARAMLRQPDGKILLVGFANTASSSDFALARFNADGTLDTSFDADGKVTTDIGTNTTDFAYAVALQSDGKIVVAGTTNDGGNNTNFALARYNTDGSLDTSFNSTGKVITDFAGSHDEARAVVIQADGKIIVGGAGNPVSGGFADHFALARYNTNGSLDASFNSTGKVTTNIGSRAEQGKAMALQPDGKIILVGYTDAGSSTNDNFAVVRYNTNGSLDTTFNGTGIVVTIITNADDEARAVMVQADGKIAVAGGADGDFVLVRYQSNGSLDTTILGTGSVSTNINGPFEGANAIAQQADGRIVLAGNSGGLTGDIGLARYLASVGPTISTQTAGNVSSISAILNGSASANGNATTLLFEYGLSSSYGSSIAATLAPITGSSTLSVSASLTGLTPGATYHYRLIGTSSAGTTNGADMTFATASTLPVPRNLMQTLPAPSTGAQTNAQFGTSVAVDGIYTVVGAPLDDAGAADSGVVKVYHNNTGALLHLIPNPEPASGDQFGFSVAVSGSKVLVGTPQDDTGTTNTGRAYVFDLSSGSPSLPMLTLANPAPAGGDEFGYAVALDGNHAVVSARVDDAGASNAGSVYVFDLGGHSPATPLLTVANPGPAVDDQFGIYVAVSGSRFVVGAWQDDTGASNAGSAYVYDLTSGTPAVPAFTLNNPSPVANDLYGRSVAISGNRVLVGARATDVGAVDSGSAYVYDLSGGTPTVPILTIQNPAPLLQDQFGTGVALSGTIAVIGNYLDDTGAADAGNAYVYDLAGGTPGTPIHTLNNPAPATVDWFGYNVAIMGARVVVGAPLDNAGATDAGSAYIYDLSSGTPTVPTSTLNSPGPSTDDRFGIGTAISGTRTVIGVPRDKTGAGNAGRVYVFDSTSGTPGVPVFTIDNPSPAADDNFGNAVAIQGSQVLVGVPLDDTGASNSGSAYFYDLGSSTPTVPVFTFINPEPGANDNFGNSVALEGTLLVIAAAEDDTAGVDTGSVYVYDLASATPTTPAYVINNPSPSGDDSFGSTVGISGRRIVIAAVSDDPGGIVNAGSVYAYDLNSGTPTVPVAEITNPLPAANDNFGYHAGISGTRIVVGALADDTLATDAGSAYVYDLTSGTPTVPIYTLPNPTPVAGDNFGHSVAIAGNWVTVGASNDGTAATGSGTAYFYDLASASPTTPLQTLPNPNPSANDDYGLIMAMDGQRFVVSAPFDDMTAVDKGAAYLFGPSSTPEIDVAVIDGAVLADASSVVNFGYSADGLGVQKTFRITNLGGVPLTGLALTKSGAHAADFALGTPASTTLAPGASTVFTVTFSASAVAARQANLHITSNDPDESPFDVTLTGSRLAGSVDPTYDPQITGGNVNDFIELADGKILVGGDFLAVGGLAQPNLTRLNSDGTADPTFRPVVTGNVNSLVRQADGKILAAGTFTYTDGGISRTNLVRLNSDGSVDSSLASVTASLVYVAAQVDGKIVVVGTFTNIQGQPRNRVARLNADGTLDAGYNPDANNSIETVTIQPSDGKVLLGGQFTTVGGVTRNNIVRLNTDGTVDTGFDPNANGRVESIVVQPDGKIIVGGVFSTVSGSSRSRLARLNSDGTLDATPATGLNNDVYEIALQPDGKILLGGGFTVFGGSVARNRIARLNADGTVDMSFNPDCDGEVRALEVLSDGRIMAGGRFARIGGQSRNLFAILDAGGSAMGGNPARITGGSVLSQCIMPDGKIMLGGYLTGAAGQARHALMRLWPHGQLDTSFNAGNAGPIFSNPVLPLVDGKLWYGRVNVATRLMPDGSTDSAQASIGAGNTLSAMAMQADGGIVVSGHFTTTFGAQTRNRLARITPAGAVDTLFNPDANNLVDCIAIQPDGKILIGGQFTTIGGTPRNRLARLNTDGTLDTSFDPNVNGSVFGLLIQPDGQILVGGSFTTVGGVARNRMARMNANGVLDSYNPNVGNTVSAMALQADGRLLIGGFFTTVGGITRNRIARLNKDGSLDTSFVVDVGDESVRCLTLTTEGQVLAGGDFSLVNGLVVPLHVRLANTPASQSLTANAAGSTLTWLRAGTSPEVDAVTFETSTDSGVTWTSQGSGARISGGWQLTGLSLPASQGYRVRARGLQRIGGSGGGDSSIYETTAIIPASGGAQPEIVVQQAGLPLTDEVSTMDFGSLDLGTAQEYSFVILNTGTADLSGIAVTLDGPHAADYRFRSVPSNALAAGGNTSFILRFEPTAPGPRLARLRIHSSDADENSFDIALSGHGQLGSVGAGIANVVGGYARTLVKQADGKIWVVGNFDQIGGAVRTDIARLNADGTLDNSVNHTSLLSWVEVGLMQADGKFLFGGAFSSAFGSNLRRLNADGSPDTSFTPAAGSTIYALAQQADGKLLIGGSFTSLGGQTRNRIGRLNLDGTLDTPFNPDSNGTVETILVQPDGKILVGGSFTTIGGVTRNRIARLNEDGTVDAGYDPNANGTVDMIQRRMDGGSFVSGSFTTIGGQTRGRMAIVNEDGTVTSAFNPNANGTISVFEVLGDGRILVSGSFTTLDGVTSNRLARLNSDGTQDYNFLADVNSTVTGVMEVTGGKIMICGTFTQVNGITRNRVARLNADGSLDTTLDPNCNGAAIMATVQQPDGKTLVGGWYTHVNDAARSMFARLNADGSLDAGFNPGPNGELYCIALQPDGMILVGGAYASIGGATRNRIARLHPDGALDIGFNPNANGNVYAIIVEPSGSILLGGTFTTIGGTTRNRLARVSAAGVLDASFNPNVSSDVKAMAVQSDGKILIGGAFGTVGGTTRNRLARLNADGTLDTGFNPNLNGNVWGVQMEADGRILVNGEFTTVGGIAAAGVARLNANGTLDMTYVAGANDDVLALSRLTNGSSVVGGRFTSVSWAGLAFARSRMALLNSSGQVDFGFEPSPDFSTFSLASSADGRTIMGGLHANLAGTPQPKLVRLSHGPAMQALTAQAGGSVVTWARSGSAPEVDRVTFETSTDGSTWASLGNGTRISAGWQLTGLSLPAGHSYVRARGYQMTSGHFGGDGSVYEHVQAIAPAGASAPEIAVEHPLNTGLVSGSTTHGFGGVNLGSANTLTYHVRNTGSAPLTGLAVIFSGANAGDFSITTAPQSPLAAGSGTTPFIVQFAPQGTGSRAATMQVWSNDADESPFTIDLTGLGFASAPTATTLPATLIQSSTALLNGSVSDNGSATTISFDYGLTTSYGSNIAATPTSLSGNSSSAVTAAISGLMPSTTYHFRVRAESSAGTALGEDLSFTTPAFSPGEVDVGYLPGASGWVRTVAFQPDGKILLGGQFTTVAGVTRNRIARLNADRTLDTGFNPNINSQVLGVVLLTDGRMIVHGNFTTVGGVTRNRIARLNADGSLDGGFNPNANNSIWNVVVQTDGRLLVCGDFTTIGGVTRNRIARLNADGTLDSSFNADSGGVVYALHLQADGKILVGGGFNMMGGQVRNSFAQLNPDGSLAAGFDINANGYCLCICPQADGKILIGGDFTTVGGASRGRLARLNADGSLDTGYVPPALNSWVSSIVTQTDGKALVAGTFTNVGGVLATRLVRLNAVGTKDETFNVSVDSNLEAVTQFPEGGLFIGGAFDNVNGYPISELARLVIEPATQTLNVESATRVVWQRGGASIEAQAVSFEASNDGGSSYTSLGQGTRISGGWELSGINLPASGHVRARARMHSGLANASIGYLESTESFSGLSAPEIAVFTGASTALANERQDDVGTVNFTDTSLGASSAAQTFTIQNTGAASLTGLVVSLSVTGDYQLTQPVLTTLAPGASTTFTVTFTPTLLGTRATTLQITSNDFDEGTFRIPLSGMGSVFMNADDFASRLNLGSVATVDISGSNRNATLEPGEKTLGGSMGASVWAQWTAPSTGWVTVHTGGSKLSTVLALYTGGPALADLQLQGHSENAFNVGIENFFGIPYGVSKLVFLAQAGTTYHLAVGGTSYHGTPPTGAFELHIEPVAAPPVRLSNVVVTPTPVDVSSAAQTLTVRVTVDSDEPLFDEHTLGFSLRPPPRDGGFISYYHDILQTDRISGTDTSGVYEVQVDMPRYVEPGTWPLIFDVSVGGGLPMSWTTQGDDEISDHYLIPLPSAMGVTVANSGPVDQQAPVLVSVSGVPANVDVRTADAVFDVDVTFTDDLSGLPHVGLFLEGEGAGFTSGSTLISGTPTNGVYRLQFTIPQGTATGTYYPVFDLTDDAGNFIYYSDGETLFYYLNGARISLPGTDVKIQVTGTDAEIGVEGPGNVVLTDGVSSVDFGTAPVPLVTRSYDFSGSLTSEFSQTLITGTASARQTGGVLQFHTSGTSGDARADFRHQHFQPRYDESWSVEVELKLPAGLEDAQTDWWQQIFANLTVGHTRPDGTQHRLFAGMELGGGLRYGTAHTTLTDPDGSTYTAAYGSSKQTTSETVLARVTFDATTKVLTAYVDGSFIYEQDLDVMSWGMTAASTFQIGLDFETRGTAVPQISPLTVDAFRVTQLASENSEKVTLLNEGTVTLTKLRAELSGAHAGDFILGDLGSNGFIDISDSLPLNITFIPQGTGPRQATLHIYSNDPDESPFDIQLTGQGSTGLPSAVTGQASAITRTSASLNAMVNDHGASTSVFFEYGLTNSYGITLSATPATVTGGSDQPVSAALAGLTPGSTYHYRVRATNSSGTTLGQNRTFTTPLVASGLLDTSFAGVVNGEVIAMAVQPDGRIIVAGDFSLVNGSARAGIARFMANGALDETFNPSVGTGIETLALQNDGKILVGGFFTIAGGQTRNRIARLNADGSLDTAFNPNVDGPVNAISLMPDGRIFIGGLFTQVGGQPRVNIARLHDDGSVGGFDTGFFGYTLSGEVESIALQPDGKIIVGGSFTSAGSSNRVARINTDGSLDTTFTASVDDRVLALALQPDGKVLVGGDFSLVNGTSRQQLARLNANGTLDTTFDAGLAYQSGAQPARVNSITLQADGDIFIAGLFTEAGGATRHSIARLRPDGTADTDFTGPASAFSITGMMLQADGRVLAGGGVSPASGFGRLANEAVTQTLAATSASSVQWLRGGAAPAAQAVSFELSTNGGSTWSPLGQGTRISGGWELTGLALPGSGQLRATARILGGYTSASSGLVRSTVSYSGLPVADIAVFNGSSTAPANERVDNTSFDIGPLLVGTSTTRTFTLRNAGSLTLGSIAVAMSGTGEFGFTSPAVTTLAAGATTSFTVSFSPTATGVQTRTILITSTDADESPFEIILTGHGQLPPDITGHPVSALVGLGQPLNLSTTATGTALQYEWMRNGVIIPASNAATLAIPAATLGHVGEWQVRVFNGVGSSLSQIVHVGVVDLSTRSLGIEEGETLVLQVAAAAPQATYRWLRGGVAIPRGINPETLLVLPGIAADQAGHYSLQVSMMNPQNPGTPIMLSSGAVSVVVNPSSTGSATRVLPKPVLSAFAPGPWIAGCEVREIISAQHSPTSFTVKGLPPGVKLNARTGLISGRPTVILQVPKRYPLTITAANAAGISAPLHTSVVVQPLPGYTVGSYHGLIARDESLNSNHGGRITLTVSALGAVSGKLTLGASSHSFAGSIDQVELGQDVTANLIVKRSKPQSALTLDLTLHRLNGELTGEVSGILAHGWRQATEAGTLTGRHSLTLTPEFSSGATIPKTPGCLRLTVTSKAGASWAGRLGDGTIITGSSGLSLRDRVPVNQFSSAKKSSLQDWLDFTRDPTGISGQLNWLSRSPTSPFPLHVLEATASD